MWLASLYVKIIREANRLGVFGNTTLKKPLESKRDKVAGEWKKIHHEEPIMCKVLFDGCNRVIKRGICDRHNM
jgi:hypothetical protein